MSVIIKPRRINIALTRRVTELHSLGYNHDFILSADSRLLCLQSSMFFLKQTATIELIDQVYDCFFQEFKYIYTVESETGEKGILVLRDILFDTIVN